MICVKFAAFCNLRADLRIRLATLRKSVRKFWFCKLALTCVDLRVRLAKRRFRLSLLFACFNKCSRGTRVSALYPLGHESSVVQS